MNPLILTNVLLAVIAGCMMWNIVGPSVEPQAQAQVPTPEELKEIIASRRALIDDMPRRQVTEWEWQILNEAFAKLDQESRAPAQASHVGSFRFYDVTRTFAEWWDEWENDSQLDAETRQRMRDQVALVPKPWPTEPMNELDWLMSLPDTPEMIQKR